MDFGYLERERIAISCVLFSFTVLACDLFEFIPEDVVLLREHLIRLPTAVYMGARMTTVGFVVLAFISTKIMACKFSILTTAFFTAARGLTSLLIYLRVHALYMTIWPIQLLFILALAGVVVSCAAQPRLSGLTSVLFDFGVFVALVWKLGWRPSIRRVRRDALPNESGEVEVEIFQRFWFPLRRRPEPEHQLIDRVLQDSLLYIVLAISLKIPQIFYFANRSPCSRPVGYWQNHSIFLDVIGICTISCKIFRDIKLGSSASSVFDSDEPLDASVMAFGSNTGLSVGSKV
ncbi:hypothetical protein CPB83DRAFT_886073 [Crepidotus variabilis]|uniref:Uncharacterized protein n=1 Tax=Crepidotus variabilis TaxID=179855 RepID=A0A9P6JLG9_9AGAR|nr:hypothetical protein CPB83DRAFT_886073 [Crepidotus variabilis]